jgi:hypothetical protein
LNPSLTFVPKPAARLQYFFWSHPEWWTLAICGLAWAVMLRNGSGLSGHGHHVGTFGQEFAGWMWMVVAMMLPQVIYEVRRTADDSLWGRRNRAVAGFLTGYLAPSLAAGIAAAFLRQGSWTHAPAAPALGFAASAAWMLLPGRRRVLIACHQRLPLAPTGWRADYDCLRYGVVIGAACLRRCWPLMLACTFSGHSLVAMAGGLVVSVVERRSFGSTSHYAFLGVLGLAGYFGALAVIA